MNVCKCECENYFSTFGRQEFMMQLTQHQGRVGSVLQEGNHMIGEGKTNDGEESDMRRQMELVNNRWENLRVQAMDRQSRSAHFHQSFLLHNTIDL